MYPINAASPERIAVGAVVQISDGAVQTSGVSISVRGQGGASGAGSGTTAYDNGIVEYTPTQAETNFTSFIVVAYKTGCIPVSMTVITSASGTPGYAGLDWSKVTNATTTVGLSGTTVKAVTDAVALPSSATIAITGNITGNVSGSVGSVTGAVGSVTGNVGGNVTGSVGSVVGAVGSVTGNVGGSVGSIAAAGIDTGAITAAELNAIADALLDRANAIEAGITPRKALRYNASSAAGVLAGAATTTVTIAGLDNAATNRITATVDADGNRSAVTLA